MNTKFLIELIEKNTRVILPEFGAFLVKDDGTGMYKNANVTFSPFLRYNDGMVEDALASSKKISKENARSLINSFIEEIKSKLLEDKKLTIENFGVLNLDKRGSVHFTPIDLLQAEKTEEPQKIVASEEKPKEKTKKPESAQTISPKPDEVKPDEVKKPVAKKETIEPKEEKTESKPEPIEALDKNEQKKEISIEPTPTPQEKPKTFSPPIKKKPVKQSGTGTGKAILIGTLIGFALVIIVAGGWYLYNKGILDFSNKEATIIPSTSNDVSDDSASNELAVEETEGQFDTEFEKLSEEMDKSASDQGVDLDNKPKEKRVIVSDSGQINKMDIPYPQEGMFHIIAGSFRNANYAEKFSTDMKSAGFNSRVIYQPSGMHAVSLGSFLTRQEASDSMNVWKTRYPNVWLLKQ